MSDIIWLNENTHLFPDVSQALREPDGLLAAGGDLSAERLMEAYRQGIFPWYEEDQPILWWSPNPRCVLYPEQLQVRAGTYQLEPNMSLYQTLEHLNTGKEYQFAITFVEGSRFSEWLALLKEAPYVEHDLTALSEKEMAAKLGI